MAEGKKYVVYGMRAKCSEGSMENYISTDTGHGVVYQGQPVLNANDHVEGVNLTHFGDCKSKLIFEEAKKQADEKYKTEEGDGFFKKLGKGIAKFATKASLALKETFGSNKCQLETPLPWIFTSKDHMIDGAPALTMDSCCACKFGGVITIVPQEEDAVAEDGETEETPEEQPSNDMAAQLFHAAKGLGLGIMNMGKEGIALALENMEAGVKSRIHQLLNFGDKERGVLQMGLSLVPVAAVNSKSKLFQNSDLKEMDAIITKYENEIYEKYKDEIDYYKSQRDKYGKMRFLKK